jgi:hypothetical protein
MVVLYHTKTNNQEIKLINTRKMIDDVKLLQLVLSYKMNKEEAKAWRVAILYILLASEYFPNYEHYKIPKGDPRKSLLFRYCYKLIREFGDKLENNEYRYYIMAQFDVLKNIQINDDTHSLISPICLVGDNAWKRWGLWSRKLGKKYLVHEPILTKFPSEEIKSALDKTKEFLVKKISLLTKDGINQTIKSRAMMRWAALGKISPYYLILSPIVKSYKFDNIKTFAVDLKLYEKSVTSECQEYFRKLFEYEFNE